MDIVKGLACAAMLSGIMGASALAETQMLKFGVITDSHHTQRPSPAIDPGTGRFYSAALAKMDVFASTMNNLNAGFVVELGDFTDNPLVADMNKPQAEKTAICLGYAQEIEARFAQFNGPRYHVFGNHDTDQASKAEYLTKVTNTAITYPSADKFYYSFDKGGVHFVVLDASYRADGSHLEYIVSNGMSWKESYVPQHELDWLAVDINSANKPTVIFAHQLVNNFPVPGNNDTDHSIKNGAELRNVLESTGKVIGVIEGHWHGGGVQTVNGIPYITMRGNVEGGTDANLYNQFAAVDVYDMGNNEYKLNLDGYGMQEDVSVTTIIPEPASLLLISMGALAMFGRRR